MMIDYCLELLPLIKAERTCVPFQDSVICEESDPYAQLPAKATAKDFLQQSAMTVRRKIMKLMIIYPIY
jgi:hypothetical protein